MSEPVMMIRSSKNQKYGKKSERRDYDEGKDRISSLPDAILSHILSFMPTKDAFRTSLLSTRWTSLWTSVPSFEFYGDSLGDEGRSSGFMDFVDRVLLLHNLQNIDSFHLQCWAAYEHLNTYRINSWICAAINRNVHELSLAFLMRVGVELPRRLFTSVNLVSLSLNGTMSIRFPMMVFLPSLKSLHLCSLRSLDDDCLKNLLSGCPVLEELDMYMSTEDNVKTICICSSTLKKLHILNPFKAGGFQTGIVIKAASLQILKLNDSVSKVFEVDALPSLVKADFCVTLAYDDYEMNDNYRNGIVKMLGKASNLQHLRLSYQTLKAVSHASAYNLLLFHTSTHLHIDISDNHWSVLPDLLGHVPSLKVLILRRDHYRCSTCLWHALPENVPKCLAQCLETIEFCGLAGWKEEMKLLRYLLENAMVLKKFTLQSSSRNKKIKTKLLKYARGSSTCQVELRYRDPWTYATTSVEWL